MGRLVRSGDRSNKELRNECKLGRPRFIEFHSGVGDFLDIYISVIMITAWTGCCKLTPIPTPHHYHYGTSCMHLDCGYAYMGGCYNGRESICSSGGNNFVL